MTIKHHLITLKYSYDKICLTNLKDIKHNETSDSR